jgi:spoIIIJ-associated protein
MTYECEGRTEKEAIDKAAEELGLSRDSFDVEILETQARGLFKKGVVKIRVHFDDRQVTQAAEAEEAALRVRSSSSRSQETRPLDEDLLKEIESDIIKYTGDIIELMGYSGTVSVQFRENRKIGFTIDSPDSSMLIGKKGKNLDALQLIVNIYAGRKGWGDVRIILDSENYRLRREESLVRMAYNVADKVRETGNSILLEPMNPFDRRLIHTTLNDVGDVTTKSEGEGLYKQVRVFLRK